MNITKEQLQKHWKTIEAWKNGAEIEFLSPICDKKWHKCGEPDWLEHYEYRIKTQPEYVPFDFSDAEKLIGKAVVFKSDGNIYQIIAVNKTHCAVCTEGWEYKMLLESFTFLDGTPCGKLKQ